MLASSIYVVICIDLLNSGKELLPIPSVDVNYKDVPSILVILNYKVYQAGICILLE